MGDVAGQWFKPFALTIACAVLVSLFVSFSLDPMLSAYWADPQIEGARAPQSDRARARPVQRLVQPARPTATRGSSAGRSTTAGGWRRSPSCAFAGAIVLQVKFGGFGFVPNSDRSELTLQVETPPGSNLAYTKMKTEEAARLARSHADLTRVHVLHRRRIRRRPAAGRRDRLGRPRHRVRAHGAEEARGPCRRTSSARLLRKEIAADRRRERLRLHERFRRRAQADPGGAARRPTRWCSTGSPTR